MKFFVTTVLKNAIFFHPRPYSMLFKPNLSLNLAIFHIFNFFGVIIRDKPLNIGASARFGYALSCQTIIFDIAPAQMCEQVLKQQDHCLFYYTKVKILFDHILHFFCLLLGMIIAFR